MYICCCCFGRSLFFSSESCVFLHQSTLLIHFATITSKTWALNFSWGKNYIVKYLPDVHCHSWWKKSWGSFTISCKRCLLIELENSFFLSLHIKNVIQSFEYTYTALKDMSFFSKVILWFCGWPPLTRKRKTHTFYEHSATKLKKMRLQYQPLGYEYYELRVLPTDLSCFWD